MNQGSLPWIASSKKAVNFGTFDLWDGGERNSKPWYPNTSSSELEDLTLRFYHNHAKNNYKSLFDKVEDLVFKTKRQYGLKWEDVSFDVGNNYTKKYWCF